MAFVEMTGFQETVRFGEGPGHTAEGFAGIGQGKGFHAPGVEMESARVWSTYSTKAASAIHRNRQTGEPPASRPGIRRSSSGRLGGDHQPTPISHDGVGVGHLADPEVGCGEDPQRFMGGVDQLEFQARTAPGLMSGCSTRVNQRRHRDFDKDQMFVQCRCRSGAAGGQTHGYRVALAAGSA